MVNKNRLIKLIRELIRIDSQNPPGDEFRIACFVKNYLRTLRIKAKTYEFKKRRTNVVAVLSGRNNKRSLLITPHLDTVPSGKSWSFKPFAGKIYKEKIFGLGATDCKGNLACALEAINSLVEERIVLDYNLIFAATADEESGSNLGLIPLLEKGIIRADAAVVLDADDFDIVITQKGLMHLKVNIKGKRAHGAYPWRGENAIDKALNLLRDLKSLRFSYKKNRYLGPPTMNIGTIKGGDKVNVVADWCEFELDFRFLPGMSAEGMLKRIEKIIQKKTQNFKIEIEGIQKPYYIDKTHPLVNYLKKAIEKTKIKPQVKGSEGATAITFFQNKNIPAIAAGFGCEGQAHMVDEYIRIDNLYKGALVLVDFLKSFKFN
jgi:succinyl-diaminopimelate desuccinylase